MNKTNIEWNGKETYETCGILTFVLGKVGTVFNTLNLNNIIVQKRKIFQFFFGQNSRRSKSVRINVNITIS